MTFRHVVVVGLMASGKTTVGRLLAAALGMAFSDSDSEIERRTGRTVRELADEIGPQAMHELEAQHLLDTLARAEPTVIAAAASTIDVPACRDALADPTVAVVWLHASPEALAGRVRRGSHRPLFGREPESLLRDQAALRDPEFARLAPIEIAVDGRSPEAVAGDALACLRGVSSNE